MGVYAALIILAISFIRIPMPSVISNSFVHPGNALVILAALLMGFKRGTLSALLGLFIFDVMSGYAAVVHFTLLENLLVLIIVSLIYHYVFHHQDTMKHIISLGVIGALAKILIIFVKFVIMQLLLGSAMDAAISAAMVGMPASLFTGLVTAVLVPVLYFPMKSIFERYHRIGE